MKSGGPDCGNVNLHGKLSKALSCGCCVATNLKQYVLKKQHKKEIEEYTNEFSKASINS